MVFEKRYVLVNATIAQRLKQKGSKIIWNATGLKSIWKMFKNFSVPFSNGNMASSNAAIRKEAIKITGSFTVIWPGSGTLMRHVNKTIFISYLGIFPHIIYNIDSHKYA